MRYLSFSGSDQDKTRYAIIQIALAQSGRRNSPNDLGVITDLARSLRTVGEAAEETKLQGIPVTLYELRDAGGVVALESVEYRMLKDLVDKTGWAAVFAEPVTDLRRWLETAGKDKPKEAEVSAGEESEETHVGDDRDAAHGLED